MRISFCLHSRRPDTEEEGEVGGEVTPLVECLSRILDSVPSTHRTRIVMHA